MANLGTKPEGIASEAEASAWVRQMFGRIAPRYDLVNTLLSFHIDAYWRNRTVKRVAPVLMNKSERVLDLCCGSGALLMALEKARGAAILGSDFCHPMLQAASANAGLKSPLFEADALSLPVLDASLGLVTVAFGFRNLANYRKGLKELRRALKPGGMLAVLEFTQPPNKAFAALYRIYSQRLLPVLGGLISGSFDAYRYLPESVRRFPAAAELAEEMRQAGFGDVSFEYLTFGIVALHIARAVPELCSPRIAP